MKNKKYVYIIVIIILLLVAAFASSYAFFSVNAENTIVGNYEVVFENKFKFSVSGSAGDNITIDDFDMYSVDDQDKLVVDVTHDITISIENLLDTNTVSCSYDYVWRWDTTKDGYKKSPGATHEYVVTGPFEEVNVPDYDATNFVLGSGKINLLQGQNKNSKIVTVGTKFYNLGTIDQNSHAGKTYKGGVIIDNIICE